jgi:hypothetical protein
MHTYIAGIYGHSVSICSALYNLPQLINIIMATSHTNTENRESKFLEYGVFMAQEHLSAYITPLCYTDAFLDYYFENSSSQRVHTFLLQKCTNNRSLPYNK